jgi:hypothetical protein
MFAEVSVVAVSGARLLLVAFLAGKRRGPRGISRNEVEAVSVRAGSSSTARQTSPAGPARHCSSTNCVAVNSRASQTPNATAAKQKEVKTVTGVVQVASSC